MIKNTTPCWVYKKEYSKKADINVQYTKMNLVKFDCQIKEEG